MYFDVVDARYERDYRIRLTFEDGRSGVVDLADYVSDRTVFAPSSDIDYFRRFDVHSGALVWGNGELDIAPERVYELATGRRVEYDNERGYAQCGLSGISPAPLRCQDDKCYRVRQSGAPAYDIF